MPLPVPIPRWVRTQFERAEELFAHVVTHHRWIFVLLFLLPLSFCYDVFWRIRIKYQMFRTKHAPHLHQQRVAHVQRQVKQWIDSGSNTKMCTSRPGWLTVSLRVGNYKTTHHGVSVDMNDILHVDTERRIVRCEPQVTMGQLTACLIPMGWTLAVVPELDDLTVGGLINGFGVETSSFRHGLFQHICAAYEIVLPTGECVTATKDQHTDLFKTIPWSYGTLGFLVSADIQIVPAKKYVHITYLPFHSLDSFVTRLEKEARREDTGIDFIEGLQYSHDTGVVMPAVMTDELPKNGTLNEIGRWYKPWFYTHVQSMLNSKESREEWIPLRDYYHRHSRSIFWEIQDIIPFGNHPLFRYALGWMVPPKIALLKLTMTPALKRLYTLHHVVQDMLVPMSEMKPAIDIFHQQFDLYPLWLCPMRIVKGQDGLLAPRPHDDMFIDVGAYGNPARRPWDVKAALRHVEQYVRDVKGYQALYADTYMTREEFRQMFDHSLYDRVRKQVGAERAFPEIYDKVSLAARN